MNLKYLGFSDAVPVSYEEHLAIDSLRSVGHILGSYVGEDPTMSKASCMAKEKLKKDGKFQTQSSNKMLKMFHNIQVNQVDGRSRHAFAVVQWQSHATSNTDGHCFEFS